MKIVINTCYGGFGLSEEAIKRYEEIGGGTEYTWDIPRDDPKLVAVVEELGSAADGFCAELKVVEIPDGVEWDIDYYDGKEHVAERHRTWW